MTTALQTPAMQPAVPPKRHKPRQPALATALLAVWAIILVGGLSFFVYWIIEEAAPNGQPRLRTGGMITIGVLLLNWVLLFWRAKVLLKLDRRVQAARGHVCLNCHTVLTREGHEGACPTCAEPFTLAHLRKVWKQHTP
jgi:hypothetical protein